MDGLWSVLLALTLAGCQYNAVLTAFKWSWEKFFPVD